MLQNATFVQRTDRWTERHGDIERNRGNKTKEKKKKPNKQTEKKDTSDQS